MCVWVCVRSQMYMNYTHNSDTIFLFLLPSPFLTLLFVNDYRHWSYICQIIYYETDLVEEHQGSGNSPVKLFFASQESPKWGPRTWPLAASIPMTYWGKRDANTSSTASSASKLFICSSSTALMKWTGLVASACAGVGGVCGVDQSELGILGARLRLAYHCAGNRWSSGKFHSPNYTKKCRVILLFNALAKWITPNDWKRSQQVPKLTSHPRYGLKMFLSVYEYRHTKVRSTTSRDVTAAARACPRFPI